MVDVSIGVRDHQFCVEVRDDGRGFDPRNRRFQALGAFLEIASAPECGTKVRVVLPLQPEATACMN